MKLATFEVNGEEKWGFLAVNPRTEQECIVVPHDVEAVIPALCRYTSYFELSKPCFIGEGKEWPKDRSSGIPGDGRARHGTASQDGALCP